MNRPTNANHENVNRGGANSAEIIIRKVGNREKGTPWKERVAYTVRPRSANLELARHGPGSFAVKGVNSRRAGDPRNTDDKERDGIRWNRESFSTMVLRLRAKIQQLLSVRER